MFPKEHGAWNALLISLAAGWGVLGQWNETAFTASLLWLSAFTLRAPLSTFRQYRIADPAKAVRALGFSLLLLILFLFSAWIFWTHAPREALNLFLFAGVPAGFLLFILAFFQRSLRFLFAEVLGFAVVCLVAPTLYLTSPSASIAQALLLYFLLGGYFLLSLFYVRVRFDWLNRFRSGEKRQRARRTSDLAALLAAGLNWTGVIGWVAGPLQALGPLYALGRILAGIIWGKENLPMMKLGIREMVHSIIFLFLILGAWK